jgi:hypothetical protein
VGWLNGWGCSQRRVLLAQDAGQAPAIPHLVAAARSPQTGHVGGTAGRLQDMGQGRSRPLSLVHPLLTATLALAVLLLLVESGQVGAGCHDRGQRCWQLFLGARC